MSRILLFYEMLIHVNSYEVNDTKTYDLYTLKKMLQKINHSDAIEDPFSVLQRTTRVWFQNNH